MIRSAQALMLAILGVITALACAMPGGSDPAVDLDMDSWVLFGVYAEGISIKYVVLENAETGQRHKLRRDKKSNVIFATIPPGRYYSRRLMPSRSDLQAIRLERMGPPLEIKPKAIHYVGDITVHTRSLASGQSLSIDIGFDMAQATLKRARDGYPDTFERCALIIFGTQRAGLGGAPVGVPE